MNFAGPSVSAVLSLDAGRITSKPEHVKVFSMWSRPAERSGDGTCVGLMTTNPKRCRATLATALQSAGSITLLPKRDIKEGAEVFGCDTSNISKPCIVKVRKAARRLDHPRRLVTLPTKRHGREIWTISLNQQPSEGKLPRDLPQ